MKIPHAHPLGAHIVMAGIHRKMADHHRAKAGHMFLSQGHAFHKRAEKYHADEADHHLRFVHKQFHDNESRRLNAPGAIQQTANQFGSLGGARVGV